MKRSSERILTTHAGALPQPADLKQMHTAQINGQSVDQGTFAKRVHEVVAQIVKKQLDCGLDIINDGEVGKSNFSRYARERLSGFVEREVKPEDRASMFWSATWWSLAITSTNEQVTIAVTTSSEFSAMGRSSISANKGCNKKSVISKRASRDKSTRRRFSRRSRPAPSSTG